MTDVLAPMYDDDALDALDPIAEERKRLEALDHTSLRRMVDQFRDGTEPGRLLAYRGRRYVDGDQLRDVESSMKAAGMPRVQRNEIKPAVLGLLGVVQQAKVDPKAYPRNPDNEEQSDIASKVLRFIADANKFHTIKVNCADNHLVEGVCGAIIEQDPRKGAAIIRVPFSDIIYDPRSREADFSDARYKGIGKWMDVDDVEKMFPIFKDELSVVFSASWSEGGSGLFEDKPDTLIQTNWVNKRERRMFVVELYHREDQWTRSVFYVGGVLEQSVSPYLDEYGEPMCPIELGSCYIDNQNQRTGVTATMLSPQDELNAYVAEAKWLSSSRQLQVSDPSFPPEVDSRTASREAKKANGVIPTGYAIVPTTDLFQGKLLMIESARQAIVRQAPTPAVLAEASAANSSGRSRLVLQQAGMTEIARALGRLEEWENRVYRQAWLRVKQFMTDPWFIRITGDDGKPGFEQVNQPVMQGPPGEDGQPTQVPLDPQQAQMMQMQGMPVSIRNNLAEMDVDIEVETIPDTANLQAEQFEGLSPLLPSIAEAFGPKKALEIGLALSSIPDKGRIKEMMEATDADPQAQQMAQMQQQMAQMAAQLQQMAAQAEIEKTQSETALNAAKVQEIEAGVTIDAIKARSELVRPLQEDGSQTQFTG